MATPLPMATSLVAITLWILVLLYQTTVPVLTSLGTCQIFEAMFSLFASHNFFFLFYFFLLINFLYCLLAIQCNYVSFNHA